MRRIQAAVWPSLRETRILMTSASGHPLLKARLGPMTQAHPSALPMLLDAVSLWQGRPIHAVLAANVRAPWCDTHPGLIIGDHLDSDRYVLDVVPVGLRRPCRSLVGLGDFRALRTLLAREVPR